MQKQRRNKPALPLREKPLRAAIDAQLGAGSDPVENLPLVLEFKNAPTHGNVALLALSLFKSPRVASDPIEFHSDLLPPL